MSSHSDESSFFLCLFNGYELIEKMFYLLYKKVLVYKKKLS